jgi:hypothetical protein
LKGAIIAGFMKKRRENRIKNGRKKTAKTDERQNSSVFEPEGIKTETGTNRRKHVTALNYRRIK